MATESSSAPSPISVLFARGVIARLAVWPALRVAVDQGWGGPDSSAKCTWLASILVDAFEEEEPKPDAVYVELALLQVMEDEFDTVLEDGSAETVAKDIVKLWQDVQTGSESGVRMYEEGAERIKGKSVRIEQAAGDASDWEDESGAESGGDESDEVPALMGAEETPSKPAVEVDEDGFTLVKGKGKRHQ